MRARALAVVVLLVSYGAVSARQPAVRTAASLPIPAEKIAHSLGITFIDQSHFVIDVVRTLFSLGMAEGDMRLRLKMREVIEAGKGEKGETVPLPLDVSIWRETLLPRPVPDDQIVGAILLDRDTALLYHGLAGLDDETLAWLGPERDTLRHLLRHAGAFAAFGPSVRVQAGKILVPGGAEAEALWQALVGAEPAKPAAFVRKLFDDESGMLAWFYTSMSQLDDESLRFAFSAHLPPASRIDRVRALLDAFSHSGNEWRPEEQPFSRRPLDPALTLALVAVKSDGRPIGPVQRGLWERVFTESAIHTGSTPKETPSSGDVTPLDAPWLVSRIHRVPIDIGRRRLEAFLFAQRVFSNVETADPLVATSLRAFMAFPALMLTLERAGATSPSTMSAAATRAATLNEIADDQKQRVAILEFQGMLAILERMSLRGGLSRADADALIAGLARVETSRNGYDGKLAAWIRFDLLPKLRPAQGDTPDSTEDAVLAAMGGNEPEGSARVVEWEGRSYQLRPARAETLRLQRIRQRQGGLTLGAAIDQVAKNSGERTERALADALTSIAYATSLGDPSGPALNGGNVALRHDLGSSAGPGPRSAWRLPAESHGARGWRITGSLLGLDVALARMSLRRLDSSEMPPEPRLVSAERQTAALSVALQNSALLNDAARDEIAAALARGRTRLEAAGRSGSRRDIEEVARDAGLSAWRRESLAWTIERNREQLMGQLSLVELMWLGQPRTSATVTLDGWGATTYPLNGCVCLAMPRAQPWESLIGRPSLGLLATRGADVAILVADTLASLKMPAAIAPGVIAFAMQEVVDQAQPAHFDDWSEFSRAALAISQNRLADYIAAQAAGGGLLPPRSAGDRHH
jgi:hypothetical protein